MMDSGKVTVINNAIDLKKYAFNSAKRKALREKLGLTNEFVIGHVGRFMYQKIMTSSLIYSKRFLRIVHLLFYF